MTLITISIIITATITIALVLMQDRSSGAGGAFGGGGEGSVYQTRRGMERFVFIATIVLVVLFSGLSIFNLYEKDRAAMNSPQEAPQVELEPSGIIATDAEGNPVQIEVTPVE